MLHGGVIFFIFFFFFLFPSVESKKTQNECPFDGYAITIENGAWLKSIRVSVIDGLKHV